MTSGILFLIIVNLFLGITAGFIMHRSDFCVAGMFRDFFLFKQTGGLRSLLLLIIVSMVLFEAARRGGLLRHYPFPLLASPSLTNIAGGVVFGIGMILAGGCVVGTLYKMGSGSLISITAFAGLIIGSGLYAEFHVWWAAIAKKAAFLNKSITLPQAVGLEPLFFLLPVIAVAIFFFIRWSAANGFYLSSQAEKYLQPWHAAVYLALLGALSFILVGMPIGITTGYAKIAALLEQPLMPVHVAGLPFFQANPLNYIAPISRIPLQGGGGPAIDGIAYIQLPLIGGIVMGSFFSAVLIREFKLYYRIPPRQYLSALAGGILLGLGSRMTPGCNIWHLFGGLPILALQSILFVIGIFPGAFIGTLILTRFVLPPR